MKDPEDEAFEELALKQGQWEHTSGWRKKQIMDTQAFPNPHRTDMTGMTLRDYFAAKAMPVVMETLCQDWTKDDGDSWYWNKTEIEMLAEKSYALADAMLKARVKNAT
jgi:hypothetical protein